jgi:hypothetical protein
MTNGKAGRTSAGLSDPAAPQPPDPNTEYSTYSALPGYSLLLTIVLVVAVAVAGVGYLLRDPSPGGSGVPSPVPSSLSSDAAGPPVPSSSDGTSADSAGGVTRYVDCSGDGPQDGSAQHPWRSLDALNKAGIPAGTVVLLRRGCSWPGGLKIYENSRGTRLESFGEGAPPILTGEGVERSLGVIDVEADDVSIAGLHVTEAIGAGVRINGANAHVSDLEIDRVAFGVEILAPGAVIASTHAHDLRMYVNTQGGSDDTGAVGFAVQANDVTIRGSSCVNCRAPSYDFGYDGGFAEIYNRGDRLHLVGNTATNIQGILEVGGAKKDGSARDVVIERNMFQEAHGGVWVHRGDQFAIPAGNIALIGNTVANSTPEPVVGGDLASLSLMDNVFAVPGPVSSSGAPSVHTGNRYYLANATSPGYPLSASEAIAPASDFRR